MVSNAAPGAPGPAGRGDGLPGQGGGVRCSRRCRCRRRIASRVSPEGASASSRSNWQHGSAMGWRLGPWLAGSFAAVRQCREQAGPMAWQAQVAAGGPEFYTVQAGRVPGIYGSRKECAEQVLGAKGVVFNNIVTVADAEHFFPHVPLTIGTRSIFRQHFPAHRRQGSRDPETERPGYRAPEYRHSQEKTAARVGYFRRPPAARAGT